MVAHPAAEPEDGFADCEPQLADPNVFTDIDRWCASLRELGPSANAKDAQLRIHSLERLASATAAVQAREAVSLHEFRRREDLDNGVPKRQRGVYAGDEIALAKRISPATGRKFLTKSRNLCQDLPHTFAALADGAIPESRAHVVADGTMKLDHRQRELVDQELAGRLVGMGNRKLGREVRGLVQQITADSAAERVAAAAEDRHVSLTSLEDGMARISATVPMIQATAVFDELRKASTGHAVGGGQDSAHAGEHAADGMSGSADDRTQSQLMADLFVQRLTGQAVIEDVDAEVHIVMEAKSLFADGRVPAWLPGHGPLPAKTARNFLAANKANTFLRRIFTSPETGRLVSMDQRGRRFSGQLRRMLVFRDDTCRAPWCDAPIKHADHIRPVAEGGETSWSNASGLCASCNYAKEHPGWRHEATAEHLTVVTPTGEYTVDDPPFVTKMRSRPADFGDEHDDNGEEAERFRLDDRSRVEELFTAQILRDTG